MAFDPTPTTWIASWSENGTDITVPIASFPELTAAEADAATGDIRKIFYAICEKIWNSYNDTASADRPTKVRVYRSTSSNDAAGTTSRTYTITFDVDFTGSEVISE